MKHQLVNLALFVRLEAKPGREEEIIQFLNSGYSLVRNEPATVAWFAVQFGPTSFGIFDAFPDEEGRQDHLCGKLARALGEQASDLFAQPPVIERLEVLASKLPL